MTYLLPRIGSIWKHMQKGSFYVVYDITNANDDLPPNDRYPPRVSYLDKEGHRYSGGLVQWHARMVLADDDWLDADWQTRYLGSPQMRLAKSLAEWEKKIEVL